MSAFVLERPRRLVIQDFPLPAVGDDDALVRVLACGLFGTDHEQYTGELAGGFAFVPGHETVGIIDTIGPRAAQRWGVAAGDRVAVEVFQSCRDCKACVDGEYRRCERHGLADMYGFISVGRAPGLWGGYAEYQYLAPDSMPPPVPTALDPLVATVFNPLGAGIRWGATIPGTGPGDVVALLGPGIRGLCALTEARVPRLPVEEAKAAADQAGVPMAELSIFQVLLNHPTWPGRSMICSRRCCGTARSTPGCAS
jgi:alcohol dehydrogenase